MARDGSGVFSRTDGTRSGSTVFAQARDAGVKIVAVGHDIHDQDVADALTASIAKDGQTTITANLPMSTKRHTGVGDASVRTDYAAAGQVQDGKLNWVDGGGTADAITATYSPAVTALVDGMILFVRATAANATTTPSYAPNGLTAHTIVREGGSALVAGDIVGDGHELILRYNLANTRWELLNPVSAKNVEDGATADQSNAEIKTAYEANADTNEFSDAEQTKLAGVASGAEVNPAVVSQVDAEAGTATDERIWTSERVGQAIDAQAISSSSVTEFSSTDTYTKGNETFVMVELWAAGGGGGSGRRGAASSARNAGGGGGGGAYVSRLFLASELGATETVTIPAGGAAGAAQTSNDSDGNNGQNAGDTTFGSLLTAYGGGRGGPGTTSSASSKGGGGGGAQSAAGASSGGEPAIVNDSESQWGGQFGGAEGRAPDTTGEGHSSGWGGASGASNANNAQVGQDGGSSLSGGPGGGSGGGLDSSDNIRDGGVGGSGVGIRGGGGAKGTAGGNGTAGSGREGGGGGASSKTTAAGAGGAGDRGGGGGGGGASLNGDNSGAGGAGGDGFCRVYAW